MSKKETKQPTLLQSFIPIIFLIILLTLNVIIWGEATLDGSNQIALLLAAAVASVISIRNGGNWIDIRANIVETIGKAMPAILILLFIGALSGTWLMSGVIPVLIYYGLDVLHPSIFLFAAVFISSLVSLATGSSWSTVATIGVALLGIGNAMGINPSITAGAIISGAYFGDKMSPLSDTTNLAPAMAGTDLFTHIRYMMYTTVPTIIITFIIFLIIGFNLDIADKTVQIANVQKVISENFNLSLWLLLVPAFLIFIIVRKVMPIPAMLLGTLVGGIFGIIFQHDIVINYSGITNNYAEASYKTLIGAMYGNFQVITSDPKMNDLFKTGGMAGMLPTIWLILSAMVFGGVMEAGGMLKRILQSIMKKVNSTGSLVASTAVSCIFFNATASDQYIAIVVPGRMFADVYKDKGYKPELLSRTLEDSGTVTSVLVPWNTCGATQSRVLGVSTIDYLPYAFFNLISPFMTILFAYLNIKIRRIKEEVKTEEEK
jgi:NhaC family Na+:H+ antiporter